MDAKNERIPYCAECLRHRCDADAARAAGYAAGLEAAREAALAERGDTEWGHVGYGAADSILGRIEDLLAANSPESLDGSLRPDAESRGYARGLDAAARVCEEEAKRSRGAHRTAHRWDANAIRALAPTAAVPLSVLRALIARIDGAK